MSGDSDQITKLVVGTLKRRKAMNAAGAVAILVPVLFYNQFAAPWYEASTSMVFDEFAGPTPTENDRYAREMRISNRLEELNSRSFSREIALDLDTETRARFAWPKDAPATFDSLEFMAGAIHANLLAYRLSNSNILRVQIQARDPILVAALTNTAADVFQERNARVRLEGVGGIKRFVEDKLELARAELERTEAALQSFKEENEITSFDVETSELVRLATDAEVMFNEVRSNRLSRQERLKVLETALAKQRQDLVPAITEFGSPFAQSLKKRLVDLQAQYTDLKVRNYPPEHPTLKQLERDLEQTKRQLQEEAGKIAAGLGVVDPIDKMVSDATEASSVRIEIEAMRAHEEALGRTVAEYDAKLSRLPQKEFQLTRLTRERDAAQKMYVTLSEKLEESRLSEAEALPSLRIIDTATPPDEPIRPRKRLNLAMGLMLGLLVGFGTGLIREAQGHTVESGRDIEAVTSWPVLASVPPISLGRLTEGLDGHKLKAPERVRVERGLVSLLHPESSAAEAYRMLRTRLAFLGFGERFKTLLVTSLGPGDGKTTTAANLAIGLANVGVKTLLVDGEVRRPTMHLIFGVPKSPGVNELLNSRNGEFGHVIQSSHVESLDIVTSGGTPSGDPNEAISRSTARIRALLGQFKHAYDYVIIDTPPLMLVHDTALVASLADAVLFVVNSDRFDPALLERAKDLLEDAGATVVGVVLNDAEPVGVYRNAYAKTYGQAPA